MRKFLRPDALLSDFTSLKEKPLREMLKKKGGVLGIHPLFSPLALSMKGETIVFCRGRNNKWVKFLKELFEEKGAKIIEMKAKEHDRQMAIIQALAHFVNISFIKTVLKEKIGVEDALATPLFRHQLMLSGRVLGGNSSLYADIQIENDFFKKTLKKFLTVSENISKNIIFKKKKEFEKDFKKTAEKLKNFIPIAKSKTTEIFSLYNKQPFDISPGPLGKTKESFAVLGPEGTFSHIALTRIFGPVKNIVLARNIREVFEAVHLKKAKMGIVPIENSLNGIVLETIDSFLDYPLKAVGSYKLKISHNLLGRTKNIKDIKRIQSHPQALAQSGKWLSLNCPLAILEPQSSSTKAMLSSLSPDIGFVGSIEAAEKYSLNVLARDIEDNSENVTEFYVISKKENSKIEKILKASKTLILVIVRDRPGVLKDILTAFSDNNLNLTKLHSRANTSKGSWDYYFFLEADCLPESKEFKKALKEIEKHCSMVRVFGKS